MESWPCDLVHVSVSVSGTRSRDWSLIRLIGVYRIAGPPKPWGDIKLRDEDDDQDYELNWKRLTGLDVTDDCSFDSFIPRPISYRELIRDSSHAGEDFLLGFLVEDPGLCRGIEASEVHDWVGYGRTVDWTVEGNAVFDAGGVELTSSCARWKLFIDD